MKHIFHIILLAALVLPMTSCAQKVSDEIKQIFPEARKTVDKGAWTEVQGKKGSVIGYVAYSKPASNGIRGYNGETPLRIAFDSKKRIISVQLLPNNETPSFVNRVSDACYFKSWNGLSVKEALNHKVDAVSGATFTSTSVRKSLEACLREISKSTK